MQTSQTARTMLRVSTSEPGSKIVSLLEWYNIIEDTPPVVGLSPIDAVIKMRCSVAYTKRSSFSKGTSHIHATYIMKVTIYVQIQLHWQRAFGRRLSTFPPRFVSTRSSGTNNMIGYFSESSSQEQGDGWNVTSGSHLKQVNVIVKNNFAEDRLCLIVS